MLAKLVVLLPLFGFLISGSLSRILEPKKSDAVAKIVTVSLLLASCVFSFATFIEVWRHGPLPTQNIINWISSGSLVINWAVKVDSLTAIMLIVVTVVSSLVHIYSLSYMSEDKSIARFMSYLSLFTFFMLALVTADNFVQLFFGWEGVGVASYLLIGFWYKKESANNAAIKAFVTNRVGDFGLMIAIALIYLTFDSVEYSQVFFAAKTVKLNSYNFFGYSLNVIDITCILLFIGAMGKSAQIGLHVWLADAMEGPTPVSALIHAATMVTAGVFLVARCSPIFEMSPIALSMVTIVGAVTAIFAATIAITQNDIKKIIAYSTCSQLGYMFFACGVSAYSAAIFHLATHAFFKALLFLGAGSVIHAMHHEQDIRKMGGIYKKIPFTYAMMWIGSLALAGFPPFAGFFSKDIILEAAYASSANFSNAAFYLGILAAFLTAFYSWRLLFLVFHGKTRADKKTFSHAHESPYNMLVPLFILSIGAVFAGIFGVKVLNIISVDNNLFIDSIFLNPENRDLYERAHHVPLLVKILPLIVGVVAIYMAYYFYLKNTALPAKIASNFKVLYKISKNKWYFDEVYNVLLVSPMKKIGSFLWQKIDVKIVDGLGPNGIMLACKHASNKIVKVQTGFLFHYATWMVVGMIVIMLFLLDHFKYINF